MRKKIRNWVYRKEEKSPSERRERQTAYTLKSKMWEDRIIEERTEWYRKWGYIYFLSPQVAS